MSKIQVIIGSTRPNRATKQVADWFFDIASKRTDLEFELIDLADWDLPFLDEPVPPSLGQYSRDHTKKWAAKIAEGDGYVWVTPEYNHGYPAVLKNAIDYLYKEWNNKAVAFVSHGSAGGARAVEQLRQVAAELQMASVRAQIIIRPTRDEQGRFTNLDEHQALVDPMLDQLAFWVNALKPAREALAASK